MGDIVRFVGTDQHLTVKQYRTAPRQYQVQRDNSDATLEWVTEIYLELVKSAVGWLTLTRRHLSSKQLTASPYTSDND